MTPSASTAPSVGPVKGRFAGVDAARGLAILGMLRAHTAPDGTRDGLADGRSSVLLPTLARVTIGRLTTVRFSTP